jgi:hypothetical protein
MYMLMIQRGLLDYAPGIEAEEILFEPFSSSASHAAVLLVRNPLTWN